MTTQVYATHQQTRQQLDELDSLLQRMLSLPLHAGEPARAAEAMSPEAFAPLPPNLPRTNAAPRSVDRPPVVQAWRMAPVTPVDEPPLALAVDGPETSVAPVLVAPYPYSLVFGQPLPTEAPPPMAIDVALPAPPAPPRPVATPIWAIPVPAHEESSGSLLSFPFVATSFFLFDVERSTFDVRRSLWRRLVDFW